MLFHLLLDKHQLGGDRRGFKNTNKLLMFAATYLLMGCFSAARMSASLNQSYYASHWVTSSFCIGASFDFL